MTNAAQNTASENRFAFGENWARFLNAVDEKEIPEAESNLVEMPAIEDLSGLTFLDIGADSGLSSLAAARLGASPLSFDLDPQSVATTKAMRECFHEHVDNWEIVSGSVLDRTSSKDWVSSTSSTPGESYTIPGRRGRPWKMCAYP